MKFSESMLEYKNVCGIYKIICSNTNFYIGSSKNIQQRFYKHRRELRKGVHKNEHLQNSYNKYGEECFELVIVEVCEIDDHSFHQIAPNLESFGSLRKTLIKVFQL